MSVTVALTRGAVAIVDDEDEWVLGFKWHVQKSKAGVYYALRNMPRGATGRDKLVQIAG